MKKISKKSKELTVDNTVKEREKWTTLLEHSSMFHQQMSMEHRSDILGAEPNKEELFHLACSSAIEDAIFCSNIVLPAFGGETIKPLCPLPIGADKSMIRAVKSSKLPVPCSNVNLSSGK